MLQLFLHSSCLQIKKTSEATLTTIQDMVTIEDYDVSECFHHSRSTESVKSTVSETYLSKPSIAKRRANQQETEQFYFMVSGREEDTKGKDFRDVFYFCMEIEISLSFEASVSSLYLDVSKKGDFSCLITYSV